MRIVRFLDDKGQTRLGKIPLGEMPGSAELLDGEMFTGVTPTGRSAPIRKLLAPFSPVNIFCIGANYAEHVKESGHAMPENPVIFMKPTTAVTNPGEPVLIPKACEHGPEVDYECELAIVIGKTCRDVSETDALRFVLGYTAANDISARRWQKQGGASQWIRGKSFDTFCPLGPSIVTRGSGADEIGDPQKLKLSTTLNGQVMQNSTTGDMIFSAAKIVSFISRDTTLLPGTLILTGTPPGVGFARKPEVWLKPGDSITVEVEKIGKLTSAVAAG
jgi:2-keto-4-pentenoate hydratase/2-oxohepta-3-ene-1,7-dioic acid hydratase in catechol pathway